MDVLFENNKSDTSIYLDLLKGSMGTFNYNDTSIIYNKLNKNTKYYLSKNKKFTDSYVIIDTFKNSKNKGVFVIKDKNNKKYVCKICTNKLTNEIKIAKKLYNIESNFIANFKEYFSCEDYDYIITEYINGKTLGSYLKDNKLQENKILNIVKQIVFGMLFLKKNNIIHCDIKCDNIMITNDEKVKIIDFDLSQITNKNEFILNGVFGTRKYISPESHDINIYGIKSDIWSLGVILYRMITKKYPINNEYNMGCSMSITRYNMFKHIDFDIINKSVNTKLIRKLTKEMLCFNVDKRIGIYELYSLFKCKNKN